MRIAMWSGPRNISTALMRSFENRTDTHVTDEPFYAYFLKEFGLLAITRTMESDLHEIEGNSSYKPPEPFYTLQDLQKPQKTLKIRKKHSSEML